MHVVCIVSCVFSLTECGAFNTQAHLVAWNLACRFMQKNESEKWNQMAPECEELSLLDARIIEWKSEEMSSSG